MKIQDPCIHVLLWVAMIAKLIQTSNTAQTITKMGNAVLRQILIVIVLLLLVIVRLNYQLTTL